MKPSPKKPSTIMAQVEGSGTALTLPAISTLTCLMSLILPLLFKVSELKVSPFIVETRMKLFPFGLTC
jgi:hypothetical protein